MTTALSVVLMVLLVAAVLMILNLSQKLKALGQQIDDQDRSNAKHMIQIEKLDVESNRARSSFMTHVSHELRTPLNVVIGYSEMLEEIAREEQLTKLLPDIQRVLLSARELSTIFERMITLSRIESGQLPLHPRAHSIQQISQEIQQSLAHHLSSMQNKLTLDMGASDDDVVVDVNHLSAVIRYLGNLVNHFLKGETVQLKLCRHSRNERNYFLVEIRLPPGSVPPTVTANMFRDFLVAEEAGNRSDMGLGLDLMTAQSLIQLMGGDIDSRDEGEAGIVIYVKIPAVAEANPSPDEDETTQNDSIMIISDDYRNANILCDELKASAYMTRVFEKTSQGLQAAREHGPSVIIIDGMMANMGGWSSLEQLKREPKLARIPVIMTTMMDEVSKTYALGAIGFLNKPVSEYHLLSVVDRSISDQMAGPILVVEDDRVSRRIMCKMLDKAGWKVIEAENGQVALDRVKEQIPIFVLLDLMMPEMGGYDFFSALRERPEWSKIPVVFVSSAHITEQSRLHIPGRFTHIRNNGDYGEENFIHRIKTQIMLYTK